MRLNSAFPLISVLKRSVHMVRLLPIGLIRLYQWTIRPMLGPHCRFVPHCSEYGIESFRRHGLFGGGWLTARRLCRCHPWASAGLDPVPDAAPRLLWPTAETSADSSHSSSKRPSPLRISS